MRLIIHIKFPLYSSGKLLAKNLSPKALEDRHPMMALIRNENFASRERERR